MLSRIVVVTSDVFVRRLAPSLTAFVKEKREFRIVDIRRPLPELKRLIKSCEPSVIVTEFFPKITDAIVKLGYPTVIVDTDELFPGTVSIDVDDVLVGQVAAEFLINGGYQTFACVYLGTPYSMQRFSGFRKTVQEAGFKPQGFLYPGKQDRNYMESWLDKDPNLLKWLKELPKPTGIFAVHDPLGRSVCEAAFEAGLRVPDDIAIVGANNDELVCGLSYPPLSSVAIPWDRIGSLVGKWTQCLLDGRPTPFHPILVSPGPIITRQSTTLSAVNDPTIRRVLHYFRKNADGEVSVGSTCAALRLSRRAVERKFSAILNCSPWESLCRIRTESAKRLLTETDLPMAHVADRSGFGSPERFSVVFRRLTGVSPSEYKRGTQKSVE